MAKISRDGVSQVRDFGPAVDRTHELGDYSVSFVSIREDHDLGPMLAGLPGGNCSCPHWGYLIKGQITVRYGDHEEVISAGEAFYLPPGHAPAAIAGTEIVQFSPADQIKAVEAEIAKMMANAPGGLTT